MSGRFDSAPERGSVSDVHRDPDDADSASSRDRGGPVAAPIVDHDDLGGEAVLLDDPRDRIEDAADPLLFVVGGNDERQARFGAAHPKARGIPAGLPETSSDPPVR